MAEGAEDGPRLPDDLAKKLTAEQLRALESPHRRYILRSLHRDVQRLSPLEISESGLVPCSISASMYHLSVLDRCGLVEMALPPLDEDGEEIPGRYFRATLKGEKVVEEVLRATARADREQRQDQS